MVRKSNLTLSTVAVIAIALSFAFVLGAFNSATLADTIDPPKAASLVISGIKDPIYAGESTGFTTTVLDQYGAVFAGYTGTVSFMSNDPLAVVPSPYTFTSADAGVHTFPDGALTFYTVGEQGLNATDNAAWIAAFVWGITVMPLDVAPHAQIVINSDSEFTPENGVRAGSGTANDPYIISEWQIDFDVGNGIEIHNANAFFVIRHVGISSNKECVNAILLDGSKNGVVENVEATYPRTLVSMNLCENIRLSGLSTGFGAGWGVVATDSTKLTISDNSFMQMWDCVELFRCSDILVSNNYVNAGDYGIYLVGCTGAVVLANYILCNNYGITLSSSTGVMVLHNTVYSSWGWPGYDNNAGLNAWDAGYPTGGNYWARYLGSDSFSGPGQNMPGSDGIGDTPYDTGYGVVDHYPLMKPYSGPSDLPPVADAGPDQVVCAGEPVQFNGSGSYDDLGIQSYEWKFTEQEPVVLEGMYPIYTFSVSGMYTVVLTVTDTSGQKRSDSTVVTVLPADSPVKVVKLKGSAQSSSVKWTYSVPVNGTAMLMIENNGLDTVAIQVYDKSSGSSVLVFKQEVPMKGKGCNPNGVYWSKAFPMSSNAVYEITATPNGQVAAYAVVHVVFVPSA